MSVLHQFQGQVLALYARIIQRTAKLTIEGWEHVTQVIASGRPIVFTSWHGQTHLLYPVVFEKQLDISRFILVSVADHRQEVLETFATSIGAIPVSISMEDDSFAGARNLIGLINELRKGSYTFITPDGPDGPPRVPKGGITYIAIRARAQIIPFAAYTPHAYRLRRWDRYFLPLPFAHIYISVRPPIPVSRDADHEMLLEKVTREINAANEQVEAMAKRRK
ncbi:MAG: hypothetical protein WBB65_00970 [Anaerolineales bacterium]